MSRTDAWRTARRNGSRSTATNAPSAIRPEGRPKGTEKQIAYATDLRDGFLAENRQMVEKCRVIFERLMQADYNELNGFGKDLKVVLTETSAHRVIDGLIKGYY